MTDNDPVFGTASGATTTGIFGSNTTYPSGFIGGGQIGYNWQLSPVWVGGLETDFQGALERHSNTATGDFFGLVEGNFPIGGAVLSATVDGSTVLNYQTKIDWFGTVRGRVGYLFWDGAVLAYITGGLAYGRVGIDGTSTTSASIASQIPISFTHAFGHSQVNAGWTVGAGTEGKLFIPGWTWKVEYLYVDLGTLDATGSGGVTNITTLSDGSVITTTATGQVTTHSHFADNIVRVGLNYQFH